MATTHEKLANSLEALKEVQRDGVVRAADLSRTHKERLIKAGFLREVVKGWLLQVDPARLEREGESTAWYGSFWNFVGRYLESRFGDNYTLSPEASLWIHTENPMIPTQVRVMAKEANNQILQLPNDTGLVIYKEKESPRQKVKIQRLQCLGLAETLCRTQPAFFTTWPREAELALRMMGGLPSYWNIYWRKAVRPLPADLPALTSFWVTQRSPKKSSRQWRAPDITSG